MKIFSFFISFLFLIASKTEAKIIDLVCLSERLFVELEEQEYIPKEFFIAFIDDTNVDKLDLSLWDCPGPPFIDVSDTNLVYSCRRGGSWGVFSVSRASGKFSLEVTNLSADGKLPDNPYATYIGNCRRLKKWFYLF